MRLHLFQSRLSFVRGAPVGEGRRMLTAISLLTALCTASTPANRPQHMYCPGGVTTLVQKIQMSQTPGVKLVIMSGSSEDVATLSVPVLSVFLFLNMSVAGCMCTLCVSAGVNTLSVHAQLCGRTHPVF